MKSLVQLFKTPQKIYQFLPEQSSDYCFAELFNAIALIQSEAELLHMDSIITLMAADGTFTEEQQFSLYQRIAYMTYLFVLIDEHFPHEYYPPFAIEAHIKCTTRVDLLNAFALHLMVNRNHYAAVGCDTVTLNNYRTQLRCKGIQISQQA